MSRRRGRKHAPSPRSGRVQPEFLTVGRIVGPQGIRGELKVEPTTDFPQRFATGAELRVQGRLLAVESSRWQRGYVILKLATIDSIDEAEKLRGQSLEVPNSSAQTLPQGQYYVYQIVGLEVWTTAGEHLGEVAEVAPTGSNDVYVVRGPRGELLIPAIEDVVKEIDLERGRITIEAVEGLL